MKKIDVKEIAEILETARGVPYLDVMLIGEPGCGKTACVKQWAKDTDTALKVVNVSALDPTDALGVPVRAQREFDGVIHETTKTAVPEWVFELAGEERACLFLDEFLCAEPSTLNAFLNFLTEKTVDGIDLSHVLVVAASNVAQYTFDPDESVLTRFCAFEVENGSFRKHVKSVTGVELSVTDRERRFDERLRNSVVFDTRPLTPRTYEALCWLKAKGVDIGPWYEGFTNSQMLAKVHWRDDVSDAVASAMDDERMIDASQLPALAATIEKLCQRMKDSNLRKIAFDVDDSVKFDRDRLASLIEDCRRARRGGAV